MAPTTVDALRDLGHVGKGGSRAHFISCDNGKEYIVKFADTTKTVVNELIGGSLALKMNLPTPSIAFVNISDEFIKVSDNLRSRGVNAGLQIGFNRLINVADFHQLEKQFSAEMILENSYDLYGIICFDNWVLNSDRNNEGNNMIEIMGNKRMHFYIVDFGHCFTSNTWDRNLMDSQNRHDLMPIFDFFHRHIRDFSNFENWFKTIEDIPDIYVDDIIKSIPVSWNISTEERSVLSNIIKKRRILIRQIITNNRESLRV